MHYCLYIYCYKQNSEKSVSEINKCPKCSDNGFIPNITSVANAPTMECKGLSCYLTPFDYYLWEALKDK